MSAKRAADLEALVEVEVERLCSETRCDVCFVPISSKEQKEKHYAGKIHSKKLQRWKDNWMGQKRLKLEEETRLSFDDNSSQSVQSELKETCSSDEDLASAKKVKTETQDVEIEEKMSVLASSSLDPKLLDQLDPTEMKKMLNLKKKKRWDDPDEDIKEEDEEDDPTDFSIPATFNKLMRRCFNPHTGVGYCQVCNKVFRSEQEAARHWQSAKHEAKMKIYHELLASEAAVLAGTAAPNPPPHRGYYCEVCEADCSSESQLEQHLSGDRHRTNLRGMERALASDPELDKDINPYNLPELWLRDRKHCYLCHVPISSIRMAKIHFNGRNHRLAAGLHITEASQAAEFLSQGDIHCDTCSFSVASHIELKTHQAGIRHLENERTRAAVEAVGGTWACHQPAPLDPPKYSVQDPGNGWSGHSIGMGQMGHHMMGPMGGHPMMMGPMAPPLMMPGPMMMGGPAMEDPATVLAERRKYAGVDLESLECQVCGVKFTDKSQLDVHVGLADHLDKAKDIPVDEDNLPPPAPEPYRPVPVTADSVSSVRTKAHSIHCPFCKVWFPSITILKYYHSVRTEHQEAVTAYMREMPDGEKFHCAACKISADTAAALWEECHKYQKKKIFGVARCHSCDMCDVHLSEADWLEKHLQGEKHKWISNKIENLEPVQWEPQEMVIVQKQDFNQFTWQYHFYPEWQCLVCRVGFTPIDRYRKHLGSLFHLRKCAGEDIQWVEGGGYHF